MKSLNPLRFFLSHLYLLQLEEYNLKRYARLIKQTRGVPVQKQRKEVIWTLKTKLLTSVSILFQLLFSYMLTLYFHLPTFTLVFFALLSFYFGFLFLAIAVIMLWPVDYLTKQVIVYLAKRKLATYHDLKIVGIAGSYGKTTMKEIVATILSEKYRVLKTPENINTLLGIARLILRKLDSDIQIMVVEMGEYKRGDITEICRLTTPGVAVVTGINEAHLERMGSLENTVEAIFEVVKNMRPEGLVVLNGDDERISGSYQRFIGKRKHFLYRSVGTDAVQTPLLGSYVKGVVCGAAYVAKYLGLDETRIDNAIKRLKPIPHRLQPIEGAQGVLVIDDSYNGNPAGVHEAIKVLSTFKDRRKIYITPGLVETGEKTREIHYNIGRELAEVADIIVLIKNSVTPYIAEGLKKSGFPKEQIVWFENAIEAHEKLKTVILPKDVVLFQNDWPDNYV